MKKLLDNVSAGLYPNPVLLVSSQYENEESIIAISWGGNSCSKPPVISIGVRKERYSYNIIKKSMQFVINIPTVDMLVSVEICGTKSGKTIDKWKECNFTKGDSKEIDTPHIKECPVSLECKVIKIVELGSHDLFLGEVVAVHIDETWQSEKYPNLLTYTHGLYKKCVEL
ncbi:MAG: flavin reductase family protein [Candidatus Heimdallarchaeota archaeon]|nr:flavin reductase family protein [Candidatus Heimdallarchaeota archaeon]